MKYIDSEKLIAEIMQLVKTNKELKPNSFIQGIAAGYGDVLSAIKSLQQEQPEELKTWLKKKFNLAKKCMMSADRDWNRAYENGEMEAYADVLVHIGETPDRSQKEQEQPEMDLDVEIAIYLNRNVLSRINNSDIIEDFTTMEAGELARHFYELGLNARKEE